MSVTSRSSSASSASGSFASVQRARFLLRFLAGELDEEPHARERRPDFVRNGGQERALIRELLLDARRHLVHDASHHAKLGAVPPRQLHAALEAPLADVLGDARQLGERPDEAPRDRAGRRPEHSHGDQHRQKNPRTMVVLLANANGADTLAVLLDRGRQPVLAFAADGEERRFVRIRHADAEVEVSAELRGERVAPRGVVPRVGELFGHENARAVVGPARHARPRRRDEHDDRRHQDRDAKPEKYLAMKPAAEINPQRIHGPLATTVPPAFVGVRAPHVPSFTRT